MASVPQREQLASTTEPPWPKRKGTEPSDRAPDREVGESQGERERGGSEREHGEERVTPQ